MNNPFDIVKNTRQSFDKSQDQVIMEVQVQFKDEPPTWIPLTTLLAIRQK